MVQKLRDRSLEEVSDHMARGQAESQLDQEARAEFLLRQTMAVEDTAKHTKRYTTYMFWSVVILALSVLGNFIIAFFEYIGK